MKQSKKISVLLHLDTSHTRVGDGKSRFYLKVRIAGKAKLYPISPELYMDPKFWVNEQDPESGKILRRKRIRHTKANVNSHALERKLNVQIHRMHGIIADLIRKESVPTHFTLGKRWQCEDIRTLDEYVRMVIDNEAEGAASKTVERWEICLKCLNSFDDSVFLVHVNRDWIAGYEHYLRYEKPVKNAPKDANGQVRKGLKQNSIIQRLTFLGKVLGHAFEAEVIHRNPMYDFLGEKSVKKRLVYIVPNRKVLTAEQVDRLHKAYVDQELIRKFEDSTCGWARRRGPRYHRCLQMILVGIYTGFRYGDLKRLQNPKNFELRNGHIVIRMQKVKKRISIKITQRLREVLNLEGGGSLFDGEFKSSSAMNDYIKEVMECLGFEPCYCWHDLRRTFASVLQEKGVDIKRVSRLLGHRSVETTEMYVKVHDKDLDKAMEVWDEGLGDEAPKAAEPGGFAAELEALLAKYPGAELPLAAREEDEADEDRRIGGTPFRVVS